MTGSAAMTSSARMDAIISSHGVFYKERDGSNSYVNYVDGEYGTYTMLYMDIARQVPVGDEFKPASISGQFLISY